MFADLVFLLAGVVPIVIATFRAVVPGRPTAGAGREPMRAAG